MGISISETDRVFQVPYGPFTQEGTPDAGFMDLKADPALVAAIPSCLGWPETRELLQTVNAPGSPLMTLAADQGFTASAHPELKAVLMSFVTLCFADVGRNGKPALADLAGSVEERMTELIQGASNELRRSLYLNVALELQPTRFRHKGVDGWSLTVLMAAYGRDAADAQAIWRIGVRALQEALPA